MPPNPILIPRKPVPSTRTWNRSHTNSKRSPKSSSTHGSQHALPLLALTSLIILSYTLPWARRWLMAGAGVESLLLLYGHAYRRRMFPSVPLWTLLATFNLVYAVCTTSWLLNATFSLFIYPFIFITCLQEFTPVANLARKALRTILGSQPHFIRDKLALFNLPALEIDTDVDGLFVIRGLTVSFSSLTLVAHGIELGLKLTDDIELAIYVDEVVVRLFRHIEIGHVYANVKGDIEMTFATLDPESDDASSEFSVLLDDTPLLRAATAGAKGIKDRPKLRETLTGVNYVRDSSARAGLDIVTTISPDDDVADQQYVDMLTEIRTSSAVYQSRQQVRQKAKREGHKLDDEKEMRAAVSAELHQLPSVPHPPPRSIRVTTLQNLSPPYMRRFMHRLPFLLRLLLAPLSYFHPISISSINAAGSGKWLSALLQQQIFKEYTENHSQLRKLQRKISTWLADANFCVQLTDIDALGQVPLSSNYDIVTYLKFDDVIAFRTTPQSGDISKVVRVGGADATFIIPSFLLPHHEHIVPPPPSPEEEEEQEAEVDRADGAPKTAQAKRELEKCRKDETNITMSVHASLPVSCDQSLLNFIASLVKATKIIELEKEVDETSSAQVDTPMSATFPETDLSPPLSPDDEDRMDKVGIKEVAGFKVFAKNIRQNLRDGTTKASIKEFAKDLHQNTREGMKKAVVGGLVNDRWVAKMVGRVAATLQKAQGDVGYSGSIPIPLEPYRAPLAGVEGTPSKLLP